MGNCGLDILPECNKTLPRPPTPKSHPATIKEMSRGRGASSMLDSDAENPGSHKGRQYIKMSMQKHNLFLKWFIAVVLILQIVIMIWLIVDLSKTRKTIDKFYDDFRDLYERAIKEEEIQSARFVSKLEVLEHIHEQRLHDANVLLDQISSTLDHVLKACSLKPKNATNHGLSFPTPVSHTSKSLPIGEMLKAWKGDTKYENPRYATDSFDGSTEADRMRNIVNLIKSCLRELDSAGLLEHTWEGEKNLTTARFNLKTISSIDLYDVLQQCGLSVRSCNRTQSSLVEIGLQMDYIRKMMDQAFMCNK
nr:MAG: hypothetical protein [Jingmen bat jeilongvirus 7]